MISAQTLIFRLWSCIFCVYICKFYILYVLYFFIYTFVSEFGTTFLAKSLGERLYSSFLHWKYMVLILTLMPLLMPLDVWHCEGGRGWSEAGRSAIGRPVEPACKTDRWVDNETLRSLVTNHSASSAAGGSATYISRNASAADFNDCIVSEPISCGEIFLKLLYTRARIGEKLLDTRV